MEVRHDRQPIAGACPEQVRPYTLVLQPAAGQEQCGVTVNRPRLETWQLLCALEIAEQGSIRRAAEKLGTRPSRLRRHMLRIEYVTKCVIFLRGRTGVRLTEDGRHFVSAARRILRSIDGLGRQISGNSQSRTTVLIGVQAPIITGRLPSALAFCREANPEADIRMEAGSRKRLMQDVALSRIDAAILAGQPHAGNFDIRHLWTEHLGVAIPKSHRFAHHSALSWADIRDETFIVGNDGRGRAFERLLRENLRGITDAPRIVRQKVCQTEILGFVRAGMGICLTSDAWRQMCVPGVRFIMLSGSGFTQHLDYVAVRRSGEQNSILDQFFDASATFSFTKTHF